MPSEAMEGARVAAEINLIVNRKRFVHYAHSGDPRRDDWVEVVSGYVEGSTVVKRWPTSAEAQAAWEAEYVRLFAGHGDFNSVEWRVQPEVDHDNIGWAIYSRLRLFASGE